MSKEIDEKVVQMTFENTDFEKNVAKSNKSLDELQNNLDQTGASGAGLANIASATESVEVKFNLLNTVVTSVFTDMVKNAINAGEQLVKSLSVDQVTAGYSKYEQMQSATQTILAATRTEGVSDEENLVTVNEQIEKLNRFSDETSYSLSDMTDNVGKFTSQGMGLEESVIAMEGISTWAAQAGQNAASASRVMYNLSQSLAQGSVKLIDWKSVENANMATAEFKQLAIDTAIEMGELNENTTVTTENFNTTLADGWFSKDVLMEVLSRYGTFADGIISFTDSLEGDISVSEVKGWITDWQEGSLTLEEFASNTGKTVDELSDTLKSLGVMDEEGNAIESLGQKAFDAAQSTKTFSEAIDATKDAVSTQFLSIFQSIFGDFLESKEMWSQLSEELYDMFVIPIATLKDIFAEWSELDEGGRSDLVDAFFNILTALKNIGGAISEAFSEIFPPLTANTLASVVKKFKEWSEVIAASKFETLKNTLKVIFSIISGAIGIIKKLWTSIEPIRNFIGTIISKLLAAVSDIMSALSGAGKTTGVLDGFFNTIKNGCSWAVSGFGKLKNAVVDVFTKIIGFFSSGKGISNVLSKIKAGAQSVWGVLSPILKTVGGAAFLGFQKAAQYIGLFINKIKELFTASKGTGVSGWTKFLQTLKNVFAGAGSLLAEIFGGAYTIVKSVVVKLTTVLKDAFATAGTSVSGLLSGATNFLSAILKAGFGGLKTVLSTIKTEGAPIFDKLKEWIKNIDFSKLISSICQVFLTKATYDLLKQAKERLVDLSGMMKTITSTIASFNVAGITSQIKANLVQWGTVIKNINGGITDLRKSLKNRQNNKTLKNVTALIISLTAAVAVFAGAIWLLANHVEKDTMLTVALSLGAVLLAFAVVIKYLSSIDKNKISVGVSSIVALAAVMLVFGIAVSKIAKSIQNTEQAKAVLIAMGGMLVTFLVLFAVMKKMPSDSFKKQRKALLGLSAVMLVMSLSILPLAFTMKRFESISWPAILKSLSSIALLAVLIAAAGKVFEKIKVSGILKFTAGLLAMSVGILLAVPALLALQKVKLADIWQGLVGLAATLAILGTMGMLFGAGAAGIIALSVAALAASVGLLALSASVLVFALAVKTLSAIPADSLSNITASFQAMADGIVAMLSTVLKWVLENLPSIIKAVVDVMHEKANYGITAFFSMLGSVFSNLGEFIKTYGSTIMEVVGYLIESLVSIVNEHAANIIECVVLLIEKLLTVLNEQFEPLMELVWSLVMKVLDYIIQKTPVLVQKIVDFVCLLIDQLAKWIDQILNKIVDFVVTVLNNFADLIRNRSGEVFDAILNVVEAIIVALLNCITKTADFLTRIYTTIKNWLINTLWPKLKTAFTTAFSGIKEIGTNLINGLIEGLTSGLTKLKEGVQNIGNKVTSWFKNVFGINSPSKVTAEMGAFLDEGLAEGMTDSIKSVQKSADAVGETTIDTLSDALNYALNTDNYDLDTDVTITPVMDLSEIQNGVRSANGMLSGIDSASVEAGYSSAASISKAIAESQIDYTNPLAEIKRLLSDALNSKTEVTNEFNISGSDPKEIATQVSNIIMRQIYKERAASS